jgi:hypothetical protein
MEGEESQTPPPPAPWKPIQQASDGFLSTLSCIHSISLPAFHPSSPGVEEVEPFSKKISDDLDHILKLDIIPFWSTLVFNPSLSAHILSFLKTDGTSEQAGRVFCLLCRIYNAVDKEGFGATFGSTDAVGRWKESSLVFFSVPVLMVCHFFLNPRTLFVYTGKRIQASSLQYTIQRLSITPIPFLPQM